MTWWIWTVVAAGLALAEMSGPGFFVIFFAAGALVTAGLLAAVPELSLGAQLGVFAATSVAALLAFRKRLVGTFGQGGAATSEDLLRDIALPLDEIAPGKTGKAELRGVPWNARNGGESPLGKGQRCKVVKVDGLTLVLQAE